jgi:hypothetical protein
MMERSIVIRKNNFSMKRTYYAHRSRSVDIDSEVDIVLRLIEVRSLPKDTSVFAPTTKTIIDT